MILEIVASNDFLCKVDVVDNNLCTFCDIEIETLEHLFLTIVIFSKDFWNNAFEWIKSRKVCNVAVSRIFFFFNNFFINVSCTKLFQASCIYTQY